MPTDNVERAARLASFDLGTNTFLLLIAEIKDGQIIPIDERETIVRLGKGVDAEGNLNAEAMLRGLECLQEYCRLAAEHQCERIVAVGTSALRQAANRQEFLQRAQHETGVAIHVISGETEAHLTYLGALSNKQDLAEPVAIIDIGGGSTEVVIGTLDQLEQAQSIDIGSVRLTERFLLSDPPSPEETAAVRRQAQEMMEQCWAGQDFYKVRSLVGTAGTITTLAAMAQKMRDYDPAQIDRFLLTKKTLRSLTAELTALTLAERKRLPGLPPARADVILAGGLILETFMDLYDFDEIIVSHRGLRHGVLLGDGLVLEEQI